jgi:hypothetical protein
MVVRLFDQPNFQGASITLRADTPAVSLDWNDRAASMIVEAAPVSVWQINNTNVSFNPGGTGKGYVGVPDASTGFGAGELLLFGGPGTKTSLWAGANRSVTLDTDGNVGIGTEAPAARANGKLVVVTNDGVGVAGVVGISDVADSASGGNGGWFESAQGEGVRGWSKNANHGGVVGVNTAGGIGVFGQSDANSGVGVYGKGGRLAGFFEGDVEITGDIRLLNADCAEDFTIGLDSAVEPGTVMVVGEDGALFPSRRAYDTCVAGVVSGAGDFKHGIVLDKQKSTHTRQPIALVGNVYCKVDAQYGAIAVGDLLTTSATPGHAMKADDPAKAFGAVIGKALRPLAEGQGLIPILIALQ